MATVEELLAKATPREETAVVCLAGELNAEHERLTHHLEQLAGWAPESLGDTDPRRALAEQLAGVEERMRGAEHIFVFRCLPLEDRARLLAAHPPRPDKPEDARFNGETFPPVLIAACCTDPVFASAEEVSQLFDVLTQGQIDRVFLAAWVANWGRADVPKSELASALTRSSDSR